jgi:AmmeMemoRadiSam system protein B
MPHTLRRAAVAGTWYPADARELAAQIDVYLAAAGEPRITGRLVGVIGPHAGLHYSGPVAAHGYGLLRGAADLTAVIVGPSHRAAFSGLALSARGSWETPFGDVPIDEPLAAALLEHDPIFVDAPRVHRDEHSLEMQLPFLARLVRGLKIVPILMGSQSRGEVRALARALTTVLPGRQALLVASSDLSHYHTAREANALDALVVEDVQRLDPDGLWERLEANHEHACGGGPIVAVMTAARSLGASRATVLHYGDSGDVEPRDKTRVVGYLSAALHGPEA